MSRAVALVAVLVLAGGAILSLPPSLPAQEPAGEQARPARLDSILRGVEAERAIRLLTVHGDELEGEVRGVWEDSLALGPAAAPQTVPVPEVTDLWVQDGSHAGLGALIGGGLSAGVGLLFFFDETTRQKFGPGTVLAGSATLVGLSALGGAALGASAPRWRRVVPAEDGARLPSVA